MKKYFLITIAVLLLSAACAKQQTQIQPAQNQSAREQEKTSLADFDGRLRIDSPKEGESVGASFVISGYAQGWFEGNIPIKVYDNANSLLFNGSTIVSNNYDSPQAFSFTVILQKALTAGKGKIVLSDYSEKDGSLVYEKTVNIKFTNEVSNWKTYKNDKYGFELKYPEKMDFGGVEKNTIVKIEKSGTSSFALLIVPDVASEVFPMSLEVYDKETTQNRISFWEKIVNNLQKDYPNGYYITPIKEVSLKGNIIAKQFYRVTPGVFEFGADRTLHTLWENKGRAYEFALSTSESNQNQEVYEKILLTFNFTE